MVEYVDVHCWECLEDALHVDGEAEGFHCSRCGRDYEFWLCTACESANQVRAEGHGGVARCEWCTSAIRVGRFGRSDTATAADWHAELVERGLQRAGAEDVLIAGFILLGGSGFDVEVGAVCSVLTLPDAVDVRAEVHGLGVASTPYTEMTGVDIADGTTVEGGGFIGGGFGVRGAAEGMLIASVLNSLTRKTTINTGLAIASTRGELLLNHRAIPHSELRRQLSPLFTRFTAVTHTTPMGSMVPTADPISQLERLARLRDEGLLTAEEFELARRREVKRLTDDTQ